jgi:hypothetical protein
MEPEKADWYSNTKMPSFKLFVYYAIYGSLKDGIYLFYLKGITAVFLGSSNGRTAAFGAVSGGSNPPLRANILQKTYIICRFLI